MRILTLLVIVCVGLLLSPQASRAAYVYTQVGSGWIEEDIETQTVGAVADIIRASENTRTATSSGWLLNFANSGSFLKIIDPFSPDAQYICFKTRCLLRQS